MSLSFLSTIYEDKHKCVSWAGFLCADNEQFSVFLKSKVVNRLDDSEAKGEFRDHLSGLELTGLGKESLAAVLDSEHSEERTWAAGEALAETFLGEKQRVVFPWNMERDKRNPHGSLPGADIVGLVGEGIHCRFAFGEVKSSSEKKYPPQVMSGRSYTPTKKNHIGMGSQIYKLANDLTIIGQLIQWLQARVKNTDHEANYNQAATIFYNSGNKNIALYGILVRDTPENERDLSSLGIKLREDFSNPTTCELTALYLPWSIDELSTKLRNGGTS